MKKIGIFCVGTGGHVLPAKNLITQLNDEGIDLDKFIIVTDERGSKYLKNQAIWKLINFFIIIFMSILAFYVLTNILK